MTHQLVTPPTEPIVATADAKAHLNVEHAEDDLLLERLIAAATRYVEKQTARQFGSATWKLHLDAFPSTGFYTVGTHKSSAIELRKCPVLDVTEIAYTDADGNPQTYAGFQLDAISEPARLFPAFAESWPLVRAIPNAVSVTFTAGYTDVPEEAVQCVLLLVGHWYANREGVLTGTISKPVEFAIEALRDSLKWTL